jgi:hypothetical protein
MRKVIVFIIFSLWIVAGGFEQRVEVDPAMDTEKIIEIIQNVPDGTVVLFKAGKYDFRKSKLLMTEKEYVALIGDGKVSINNLSLILQNSSIIKISNLYFEGGYIKVSGTKVSEISNTTLENNKVYLLSSSMLMKGVSTKKIAKGSDIYIKKSIVKMLNSFIETNSTITVYENSFFFLKKSRVLGTKGRKYSIYAQDSFIYMYDNLLSSNVHTESSIYLLNSNSFMSNNIFRNGRCAVWMEGKDTFSLISKNIFQKLNIGVVLTKGASSLIYKNSFFNFFNEKKLWSRAIYIYDEAKADIRENIFKNLSTGVYLSSDSEANIISNTFDNLSSFYHKNEEIQGYGFYIDSNGEANILQNKIKNFKGKYFGSVDKKSFVYIGQKGNEAKKESGNSGKNSNFEELKRTIKFLGQSIKNPQSIEEEPIKILVKFPHNFLKVFDSLKSKSVDITSLKQIHLSDKGFIKKRDESSFKKGYLEESIIVQVEDGDAVYEEVIEKGRFLVFDSNSYTIIEPKEYKGCELDEEPPLSTNSLQREIVVDPIHRMIKGDKYLISFKINSNVDIEETILDDKVLRLKTTTNPYYTIERIVRRFGLHLLKIQGRDFTYSYECIVDKDRVDCYKK